MAKKVVKIVAYLCATVAICFLILIGLPLLALTWAFQFPPDPDRSADERQDPGTRFAAITGLAWPRTASVVSVRFIDMFVDYEYQIVFDVDPTTLNNWLSSPPPWEQKEWHRGPLPDRYDERGSCVKKLTGTIDVDASSEDSLHSIGSQGDVLWFAVDTANEQSGENFGPLLLLDPRRNRICLEVWTT